MADTKISADPSAGTLDGTETIPVVAGGANKRTTGAALLTYIQGAIGIAQSQVSGLVTALAGKLSAASNLSDVANAGTARTNLGLGTAATQASSAFEASGAVSTHNSATTSVHGIADTAKLQSYGRTTFSNADATVSAGTHYLAQIGTLSAARTVTLPAASAVAAGFELIIADESGSVTAANTITIQRAGSDTVNGGTSTMLNTAYGRTTLISDGTSKWTVASTGTNVTPTAGISGVIFDDFWQTPLTSTAYTGPLAMIGSIAGASAALASASVSDASAIGICQLTTGTTSGGRAAVVSGLSLNRFGGIAQSLTVRFQFPSNLLNGTESGAIYIGFLDSQTGAPIDGAYLYWDNTQTNFRYRTRNNTTETDVDSGLAPAADTWYALVISANAAGTAVTFTLDANASRTTAIAGSNSQSLSTNIPTASGRETGIGASIIKSAGTTARLINLDYFRYGWGGQ